MNRCRLAVAVAAVIVLAGVSEAATTYYVATNGNDNASCGTSAAPCRHIQYAIDNRAVDGDTVRVKSGTYNECIFVETDVAVGAITLETEAFAVSGTPNAVTLDGNGVCDPDSAAPGPVVIIFDRSVIRGFRIQNGGDSGIWGFGTPAITNNTITQNSTSTFAGGIFAYTGYYVTAADLKMQIKSNTITSNTSVGSGAGVYVLAAGVGHPSVVEIDNNTISSNDAGPDTQEGAAGAFGGGMTILTDTTTTTDVASVVITRNTIDGNTASNSNSGYPSYGGGLFVATGIYYGYGTETVTVGEVGQGNSIRNNSAEGYGGGVSINLQPGLGADLHAIKTAGNAVSANTGGRGGGGIHGFFLMSDPDNGGIGKIEIEDNAVTGNAAADGAGTGVLGGGGIFAEMYSLRTPQDQATFEIERNQFQLNHSNSTGGGVSLFAYADADPELNGVTLEAHAEIDFRNNLVSGNEAINTTTVPVPARGGGVWAAGRAFGDLATSVIDQDFLTVVENDREAGAGGLEWEAFPELDSNLTTGHIRVELTNSIIANNQGFGAGGPIVPGANVSLDIRYNDSFGNGTNWEPNLGVVPGTNGNVSFDPQLDNLFVPELCSPTVDAGDPAVSASLEPQPNGGIVNLGHLGGTANATRTLPDSNGDGTVDGIDILRLAVAFGADDQDPAPSRFDPSVDFDADGDNDGDDLSYLAALYARSCP